MRDNPGQVLSVCQPSLVNTEAYRAASDHCFNVAYVRLQCCGHSFVNRLPGVSAHLGCNVNQSNQILQPFCSPSR